MYDTVGNSALRGHEADHRHVRRMATVGCGEDGCLVQAMELTAHDCILGLSGW